MTPGIIIVVRALGACVGAGIREERKEMVTRPTLFVFLIDTRGYTVCIHARCRQCI